MAHLPMVLDETGKKYSKRLHGANVLDWRDDGFLPRSLDQLCCAARWDTGGAETQNCSRAKSWSRPSRLIAGVSPRGASIASARLDQRQHIRRLSPSDCAIACCPSGKHGLDVSSRQRGWLEKDGGEPLSGEDRDAEQSSSNTPTSFSATSLNIEEKGARKAISETEAASAQ